MYNSELENSLLLPDIADRLTDYVPIQLDIDDTKIKAACLVAQKLDIEKVITTDNWDRAFEYSKDSDDENEDYDEALFKLIVPALCYFTYARCLKMFQGNLTDSGYSVESAAESLAAAKASSHEYKSVGTDFLQEVIDYLEQEDLDEDIEENIVPRVITFGGVENRATN